MNTGRPFRSYPPRVAPLVWPLLCQCQSRVEKFSRLTLFSTWNRKRAPPPAYSPPGFRRLLLPGLSRCGVSDGPATQRGSARIGKPIRGPAAGQRRQPQRVQPGGFFRPLFGRSKRGHLDESDRQDSCRQAEVRICTSIEPQREERTPPCTAIPRPSAGGRDPVPEPPSVVANAIGHIDDRAGVPSTRNSHCVKTKGAPPYGATCPLQNRDMNAGRG